MDVSRCSGCYFLISSSVILRTGLTYALTTLSFPSAPIAATLGFGEVCSIDFYMWGKA